MGDELQARRVTVRREQPGGAPAVTALDGVDLSIAQGELVALMGGTGAGKTTLALALAGLVAVDAGSVEGPARGAVRMVLQRPESTFLTERVLDEVALADIARGTPVEVAQRRAVELLTELALPADVAGRDPLTLSGGEQRRVAIAAVLATDPRVLVLDEPSAGLDPAARRELHATLARLHAAGRTILLITHDPAEAAQLATRLVVLRAGRVAWDGGAAAVLGSEPRAAELGLQPPEEVRMLHALARARGITLADGALPASQPEAAIDAIAGLLAHPTLTGSVQPAPTAVTGQSAASGAVRRAPLAVLIDSRVRIIATALAVAAALMCMTLVGAAVVLTACAVVVALARIDRARVRLAIRPMVALAVLLVVLQLIAGGDATTSITRTSESSWPALAAILRAMQATAVVLATLALSAATAPTDLAAGIASLLRPLRLLRVPVEAVAFTIATALGLVPAFADELERLRLAQRARGMGTAPGIAARVRREAALLVPLFVAGFRRAHLLADALAVRGFDPRGEHQSWRPRTTPSADVLLLGAGAALIIVSRFV